MKIVVCYSSGGGWECDSYDHVLCFEYESPEAWLVHFDEKLKETKERRQKENEVWQKCCESFEFCGHEFSVTDFVAGASSETREDFLPEVYDLNEWFAANCINPGVSL